jgi:putative toxin-antitoxin system antitoxin component (TIGR02293 family)
MPQTAAHRRASAPPPAGGAVRHGPLVVTDNAAVFKAAPVDRIYLIRVGVPATDGKRVLQDLKLTESTAWIAGALSTFNKRVRDGKTLPEAASERLVGLARLVGQVEAMVRESGDPTGFDAVDWTSQWLHTPLPALGGKKPMEFMDTMEGQGIVSDTLARIASGAFA